MKNSALKRKGPFFFLHIPRTGGTSVNDALKRSGTNLLEVYEDSEKEAFLKMGDEEKSKFYVISSHSDIGFAGHIPNLRGIFCLFRDPYERLISHYYSLCKRLFVRGESGKIPGFSDFLKSRRELDSDNGQVRYLSGSLKKNKWEIDNGDLDKALENLEKRFVAVGILEKFDYFAVYLRKVLGVKSFFCMKTNNIKRAGPDAGEKEYELVEKCIEHDRKLYFRISEKVSSYMSGISDSEVRAFRAFSDIFPVLTDAETDMLENLYEEKEFEKIFLRVKLLADKKAEHDGENLQYLYNLAGVLERFGKYRESEQIFLRILGFDPPFADRVFFSLACLSERVEDFEKTEYYLIKLLEINKRHWNGTLMLRALRKKGGL